MYNYKIFQKSFKKKRNFLETVSFYFHKIPFLWNLNFTKEIQLTSLFWAMFLVIIIRLFYLQIIQHDNYNTELMKQSTSLASINAERWDIYALDKTWQPVKLTENINLYDVALDPREIWYGTGWIMKDRFIELISPVVYKHLCVVHWMDNIEWDTEHCIKNIENFSNIRLLPEEPEIFYFGKEYDAEWNPIQIISPEYSTFNYESYYEEKQRIIDEFSYEKAMQIIKDRLNEKIKIWIKEKNYVWYYTNNEFLEDLRKQNFGFISIEANFYLYVVPNKVKSYRDKILFQNFMSKWKERINSSTLDSLFKEQTYKYIKLFSSANPQIAQDIKDLKDRYKDEKYSLESNSSPYNRYSIVHGIILEPKAIRYYPYGEFMSNILWYVDKNWEAYYWIEKYYDNILKWINWKITWRSSRNMWWSDFEVINTKDGDDVVLTIDIWIQKEVEAIAKKYIEAFHADSLAVMVFDPNNWQIKASVSLPSYNPNNYNDAYTIIPLGPEYSYLVDNETYNEVPVYIYTWWKYTKAKSNEKTDITLKKYISKNIYWSSVFVDKNISIAFEPGSIFKAFTMAIWLDSDEVRLDDYYQDDWSVKIDIYTIQDADKTACTWYHSLLEALINSCNVWMIRIVQALGKEIFYNYLNKFWFWESTWIELAEEKNGSLPSASNVSMAAFFNNSFWQWVTVTQIQLAVAYSALINWWKYMNPTIVSQIRKKSADTDDIQIEENKSHSVKQIIRPEVSDEMRNALHSVMQVNDQYKNARVEWYRLGSKSWTSQIAYKWKYQRWEWWTQATFAWIVSIDDPQYVVLIWLSRPRTSQWWVWTSWKIFGEIATFLIWYSMME